VANVTVPQATAYSPHHDPYNAALRSAPKISLRNQRCRESRLLGFRNHPIATESHLLRYRDPEIRSAASRRLSRLATHFSIFYHSFSHKPPSVHAKETGRKTETNGIIPGNRPQLTTTHHNSPQTPIKTAQLQPKPGKTQKSSTTAHKPRTKPKK